MSETIFYCLFRHKKNVTFYLLQLSRKANLDDNLKLRQHQLFLVARFMKIKSINPNMKQKEITKELGFSSSTLQRPYKPSKFNRTPNTSNDLKRP